MTESMEASSGESMPPEQQVTAVDLSVLLSYLKALVPPMLEDNNQLFSAKFSLSLSHRREIWDSFKSYPILQLQLF